PPQQAKTGLAGDPGLRRWTSLCGRPGSRASPWCWLEARWFEPPWRFGAKRQLIKLLIFIAGARSGASGARLDLDRIAGKQCARSMLRRLFVEGCDFRVQEGVELL